MWYTSHYKLVSMLTRTTTPLERRLSLLHRNMSSPRSVSDRLSLVKAGKCRASSQAGGGKGSGGTRSASGPGQNRSCEALATTVLLLSGMASMSTASEQLGTSVWLHSELSIVLPVDSCTTVLLGVAQFTPNSFVTCNNSLSVHSMSYIDRWWNILFQLPICSFDVRKSN